MTSMLILNGFLAGVVFIAVLSLLAWAIVADHRTRRLPKPRAEELSARRRAETDLVGEVATTSVRSAHRARRTGSRALEPS